MQPITQDSCIVIRGRNLLGSVTRVRVGQIEVAPLEAEEDRIKICLSDPPFTQGSLRAGINSLQVIHVAMLGDPPVPHRGFESNAVAFVLRPTIVSVKLSKSRETIESRISGELSVQVKPQIGRRQRAVLFLNETGESSGEAYIFRAVKLTDDSDLITFPFENVKSGAYAVRIQVDGAESPLYLDEDLDSSTRGLYVRPKVAITVSAGKP
jgi:hypothetical protein